MKNQIFQMKIAQAALAALMSFSFGGWAQTEAGISLPGCGDCERVARISQTSRDMLAMAQQGVGETREPSAVPDDGRMNYEDFKIRAEEIAGDTQFAEAIQAAADATVAITEVRNREGKVTSDGPYNGSGFVVYHRGFVATSLHVVNDLVETTALNGERVLVPDGTTSPLGYTVKILHKSQSGEVEELTGTVVKVWPNPNSVSEDVTLIRLNQKANVKKVMGFGTDRFARMAEAKLATVGYPVDWQPKLAPETKVVHPNCNLDANKSGIGVLITNCISASGGSGGPVVGRIATKAGALEYRFVGIASVVNNATLVRTPSGLKADYGTLHATDAAAFAPEMEAFIRQNLKELPFKN